MSFDLSTSRKTVFRALWGPFTGGVARPLAACLLSLALVAAIVAVDIRTGPHISLSLFYLGPILLASWFAGIGGGLTIAFAGCLAWFLWDPAENAQLDPIPLWNVATRFGVFSLVAAAIGTLHASIDRERRTAAELRRFNEHLDRQVKERTEGLRRSIREMEVFTYTMAHDLRAPLRAIHGFSDLLGREHGESIPAEAKEWLQRIAGASRKMDRLILDLLEYGNLIHCPVERKPTALEPICRAALDEASSKPSSAAATAEIRLEEPLPCVTGDPRLLTRVFEELVSNALAFARPGVPLRVRIQGRQDGDRAVVWVEDNGAGIPPEHRHRIFLPFQQLAPPTDEGGTGMGLAMVRKALERMDGSIEVESETGKGSRFRIELKASASASAS